MFASRGIMKIEPVEVMMGKLCRGEKKLLQHLYSSLGTGRQLNKKFRVSWTGSWVWRNKNQCRISVGKFMGRSRSK
jgi:hypothetical protein